MYRCQTELSRDLELASYMAGVIVLLGIAYLIYRCYCINPTRPRKSGSPQGQELREPLSLSSSDDLRQAKAIFIDPTLSPEEKTAELNELGDSYLRKGRNQLAATCYHYSLSVTECENNDLVCFLERIGFTNRVDSMSEEEWISELALKLSKLKKFERRDTYDDVEALNIRIN